MISLTKLRSAANKIGKSSETQKSPETHKHLFISDPEQHAYTGIQPIVRWAPLVSLPPIRRWRLQVYGENGFSIEHEFDGSTQTVVPGYLMVGNDYRLRIVADAEDGSVILSPYRHIKVEPDKAFPKRIECTSAWRQTFIGHNRANPCCNLKKGAGFPFVPGAEQDFHNSPGMIAIREALLKGDSRFCHYKCPQLQNPRHTDIAATGLPESSFRAMTQGAVTIDHPPIIKVSLGSYCNHACTFCKKIQVDNDWKQDLRIFDYVRRHAKGIQQLTVTGGEPLVFMKMALPHIREIAEINPDMRLFIMTNGALLESMADTLTKFNHLSIQISCNAATRETYKQVHRVDDFDKVCAGIKAIKAKKPDAMIRMKMVYMRPNISDLAVYPELAKSLGADEVRFSNMTFFPKADASRDDAFDDRDQDWGSVAADLEIARQRVQEMGIIASTRRPGDKRLDRLDGWDEDEF